MEKSFENVLNLWENDCIFFWLSLFIPNFVGEFQKA
jgi:hypothetical protein